MSNMDSESLLWRKRKPSLSLWNQFLDEFLDAFPLENLLKRRVFICGSYKPEAFQRLQLAKEEINREENYFAFLMADFKRFLDKNYIEKFSFLASFSNTIIMIIEHEEGFLIEFGIIIANKHFYDKTTIFVLKKAQDRLTPMLTKGGFKPPFYTENKNLFYFNTTSDLLMKIRKLLKTYN
jgi:hypothetical protein